MKEVLIQNIFVKIVMVMSLLCTYFLTHRTSRIPSSSLESVFSEICSLEFVREQIAPKGTFIIQKPVHYAKHGTGLPARFYFEKLYCQHGRSSSPVC